MLLYENKALDKKKPEPCIYVKVKNLENIDPKLLKDLLYFNISTYTKANKRQETWELVFGPINKFFKSLDNKDQELMATFLVTCNFMIKKMANKEEAISTEEITSLMLEMSKLLNELDQNMDLCDKLKEFGLKNTPISDMEYAGNRPHDKKELTIYQDEAEDLLAITLLCKFLAPIFGTLIFNFKKKDVIETRMKELHYATMMKDLIHRKYFDLAVKLKYYIEHTIRTFNKNDSSIVTTNIFNTHTEGNLSEVTYAKMMLRFFVNVNLYYSGSNLAKYVFSVIKREVDSLYNGAKNKPVLHRMIIGSSEGEEGNISYIEIDSLTSNKSFDTKALIMQSVDKCIPTILVQYEIDPDVYESSLAFYKSNAPVFTSLNSHLCCAFFGQYIGGGKGVLMLDADHYSKILTLLQLVILSNGHIELANFLTAKKSMTLKHTPTPEDNQLRMNYKSSQAYAQCKARYAQFVNPDLKGWDVMMDTIATEMVTYEFTYCNAPAIWDLLKHDNVNGSVLPSSYTALFSMCKFIEDTLW